MLNLGENEFSNWIPPQTSFKAVIIHKIDVKSIPVASTVGITNEKPFSIKWHVCANLNIIAL